MFKQIIIAMSLVLAPLSMSAATVSAKDYSNYKVIEINKDSSGQMLLGGENLGEDISSILPGDRIKTSYKIINNFGSNAVVKISNFDLIGDDEIISNTNVLVEFKEGSKIKIMTMNDFINYRLPFNDEVSIDITINIDSEMGNEAQGSNMLTKMTFIMESDGIIEEIPSKPEEKPTPNPGDGQEEVPDSPNIVNPPETGDDTNILPIIGSIILSSSLILYLLSKKEGENDVSENKVVL